MIGTERARGADLGERGRFAKTEECFGGKVGAGVWSFVKRFIGFLNLFGWFKIVNSL